MAGGLPRIAEKGVGLVQEALLLFGDRRDSELIIGSRIDPDGSRVRIENMLLRSFVY